MPLWRASTVAKEPSTALVNWQVQQFADGSRSFVGYAVESQEGRVSSAVVAFDVKNLRGVTASGRVYQLKGSPGVDADGAYLWSRYVAGHENETSDVTAQVWSEHLASFEAEPAPAQAGDAVHSGSADHA